VILTPEFRPWVVPFEITGDISRADIGKDHADTFRIVQHPAHTWN